MCIFCKRRKTGSRRSAHQRTSQVSPDQQPTQLLPVDPIIGNLNEVRKVPESKLIMKKPCANKPQQVQVASIDPGEAIVMPLKGEGALKRVFLGIGWRASKSTIDVDCTCAPYSKGIRIEEDTVWYHNLQSRNYTDDAGKQFVSTKHSGDVLSGQDGSGELEDLERIYLDLESSPEDVDCFAFESNVKFVFTEGVSFNDLDSAYIRMVNVDTNQEIMRCDIKKDYLSNTQVILLSKLFRGKDRWVLHACVESRDQLLVRKPKGQIEPEMYLSKLESLDAPEAPISQEMDRGSSFKGRDKLQYENSKKHITGKRAARPSNSYLMPAVALGTAASITAAILLFRSDSPLSVGEMSSFSNGSFDIDFVNLVSAFTPTDCGCLSDFDVCGQNLGDGLGGVFDFVCQGGCCESLNIENPCACLGVVGLPLKQCIGSIAEVGGDCIGSVCDGVSSITSTTCGCPCEDMCDIVFVCDQCGCPDLGNVMDQVGSCCKACGGAGADVMDNTSGALETLSKNMGPALDEAGSLLGTICKELMNLL